jgi:hypothetical protein
LSIEQSFLSKGSKHRVVKSTGNQAKANQLTMQSLENAFERYVRIDSPAAIALCMEILQSRGWIVPKAQKGGRQPSPVLAVFVSWAVHDLINDDLAKD